MSEKFQTTLNLLEKLHRDYPELNIYQEGDFLNAIGQRIQKGVTDIADKVTGGYYSKVKAERQEAEKKSKEELEKQKAQELEKKNAGDQKIRELLLSKDPVKVVAAIITAMKKAVGLPQDFGSSSNNSQSKSENMPEKLKKVKGHLRLLSIHLTESKEEILAEMKEFLETHKDLLNKPEEIVKNKEIMQELSALVDSAKFFDISLDKLNVLTKEDIMTLHNKTQGNNASSQSSSQSSSQASQGQSSNNSNQEAVPTEQLKNSLITIAKFIKTLPSDKAENFTNNIPALLKSKFLNNSL